VEAVRARSASDSQEQDSDCLQIVRLIAGPLRPGITSVACLFNSLNFFPSSYSDEARSIFAASQSFLPRGLLLVRCFLILLCRFSIFPLLAPCFGTVYHSCFCSWSKHSLCFLLMLLEDLLALHPFLPAACSAIINLYPLNLCSHLLSSSAYLPFHIVFISDRIFGAFRCVALG
jgi:hypothetical protein